jgi:O-antigen ligase
MVPLGVVVAIAALAVAIASPMTLVEVGIIAIPLEGFVHRVTTGIFLVAAAGWLLRWATTSPVRLPRHPALLALTVYVLANAAGLLFAPEPTVVARQVLTFTPLLIVAVMAAHPANRSHLPRLMLAVAISGGLLGLVAIADPRPLTGYVYAGPALSRATAGLGSPNVLGMLLGLSVPVQVLFAIKGSRTIRLIGLACLALALTGMTLSVSRAAFIGVGASVLVLAGWRPFRQFALIAVPLVAVLALVGHNPATPVTAKVVKRFTSSDESTGTANPRIALWKKAPRMIADRPIFGEGALEYAHYAPSYGVTVVGGVATHAHNLLLTAAVETGLVGALALLGLFWGLALAIPRILHRARDSLEEGMGWALGACVAGFFVNGILDYALGAAPVADMFIVLSGITVGLALAPPSRAVRSGRPAKPLRAPARTTPPAARLPAHRA